MDSDPSGPARPQLRERRGLCAAPARPPPATVREPGKSGEEAGWGLGMSHPPPPGEETPYRSPSAQLKGLRPFLD